MKDSLIDHFQAIKEYYLREKVRLEVELDKAKKEIIYTEAKISELRGKPNENQEESELFDKGDYSIKPNIFSNLGIVRASAKCIEIIGKPLTTKQLADYLTKGDIGSKSKPEDLVKTLTTMLYKENKRSDARVVRIGGKGWGLKSWKKDWGLEKKRSKSKSTNNISKIEKALQVIDKLEDRFGSKEFFENAKEMFSDLNQDSLYRMLSVIRKKKKFIEIVGKSENRREGYRYQKTPLFYEKRKNQELSEEQQTNTIFA